MLETVIPRLLPPEAPPPRIIPYKGIGHLPPGMKPGDVRSRSLLNKLPGLIRGYESAGSAGALLIVVDSDRRDCREFLGELRQCADANASRLRTIFRIAIEETEAWLLSDRDAVLRAYPKAKKSVLDRYEPDSICGTWETLAEAIHPGGRGAMAPKGYAEIGMRKYEWATRIGPHLDLVSPRSPSFAKLVATIRELAGLYA